MAELKNVRRKVARGANAARRDAEEMIEEGMDHAREYAGDLRERAEEVWTGAKGRVKKGAAQTQDYAEENPWHMAAIGAVAGFLLAALVIRRRD